MNPEIKNCQNCKTDFTIEPEDFFYYEKMKVPAPTWCPSCRLVRRMTYKNLRTLYKRVCDLCKRDIVSVFHKNVPFPVYCPECWWSDKWDAIEYGQEYDFSKPFFTQFAELVRKVPKIGLLIDYPRMVNSDYANLTGPIKNCYLVFLAEADENCLYSTAIFKSKDSVDCVRVTETEQSYALFNCHKCYRTFFSVDCTNCLDVFFSRNLTGCSYCFGCANLKGKKYCLFNESYSKEEYINKVREFNLGSWGTLLKVKARAHEFWLNFPQKYVHGVNNVNISGDYLNNSKNARYCFEGIGVEDSKYCHAIDTPVTTNCYDYGDWGNNASFVYDSINCGENIDRVFFSYGSWVGTDWYYTDTAFAGHHSFGTVSTKKKNHCILNKLYSKEEYEKLVPRIIEHMNTMPYVDKKGRVYKYGEFFPPELSHFAYNETVAQEYFPLTEEEALLRGYRWRDIEEKSYQLTKNSSDFPDHIDEVKDDILNEVIQCEHRGECVHQCTTAFRIVPQELAFYRRMNLPLPRLCHNCRYAEWVSFRNPLKLWRRKCQCNGIGADSGVYRNTVSHEHGVLHCPNEFETSYSPDRKEIIYCEQCYLKEVV